MQGTPNNTENYGKSCIRTKTSKVHIGSPVHMRATHSESTTVSAIIHPPPYAPMTLCTLPPLLHRMHTHGRAAAPSSGRRHAPTHTPLPTVAPSAQCARARAPSHSDATRRGAAEFGQLWRHTARGVARRLRRAVGRAVRLRGHRARAAGAVLLRRLPHHLRLHAPLLRAGLHLGRRLGHGGAQLGVVVEEVKQLLVEPLAKLLGEDARLGALYEGGKLARLVGLGEEHERVEAKHDVDELPLVVGVGEVAFEDVDRVLLPV
mmetsp:Transcript_10876/g.27076  ORF Transcript_10876/g.27076 Transcript_10876/m.27076 type:complete len:262 (-) Transcript_10876:83-868(-)